MKPDWKDAPEWAKYLAMDGNGSWYWYENKPIIDWDELSWIAIGVSADAAALPDWSESLEKRPNDT